jgi:xylulokinase
MLSAAGSLEWARQILGPNEPIQTLLDEAAHIAPGCDGLLFLPHLTGERCPYPDPAARGAWVGLVRSHTRGHLIRSVLEGVACTLGQVYDLVTSLGIEARELRVGGGGAKSTLWRQILADVLNRPITTLATDEGPAHGAALIAATGAGRFPSLAAACNQAVHRATTTTPSSASTVYGAQKAAYARLYPTLAAHWTSAAQTDC